jgi:hypothetical protein
LTCGSVAWSDGGNAGVEHGGNMDIVPFFLGEGVDAIKNVRFRRKLHEEYDETYTFFFWPFFLKFLGFFPAVIAS